MIGLSAAENKTLLRRYTSVVREKQTSEAAEQFLESNYQRYISFSAKPLSREDQIQRLICFHLPFTDIQLTIEEMIADCGFITFHSRM